MAPPELRGAGAGGARNRANIRNFETSGSPSSTFAEVVSAWSSGSALKWHAGVSSRSVGNPSFVTPCSTA